MPTLTLIRHGQASFGADNYDQLSPLGFEQTQHLGEFFKRTGQRVDGLITGSMQRHLQSCQSFCTGFDPNTPLTPSINAHFDEFDHEQVLLLGSGIDNKADLIHHIKTAADPDKTLFELFSKAIKRWHSGQFDDEYTETWLEFKQRTLNGLHQSVGVAQALSNKNANVLVFSSGGVIACIAGALLGLSDRTIFELNFAMANGAISKVMIKNDHTALVSLNEYSYLHAQDKNLITWR